MSVQTDARTCAEQCTQVNIDQSTQWTQCIVSRTDESVQATCKQSLAAVQVAPETSDADIQTVTVVAEPAVLLHSALVEDKHVVESEIIGHHQADEGSRIVAYDKDSSSVSAELVIELIEDSPGHSDSPSSERPEDHSTPATGDITDDKSNEVAAEIPVTSASVSTVSDQLSNQYDRDAFQQVPARVHNQILPITVSATSQPAAFQPSFNISTASEYVYSFEQQTFRARSLLLQHCCEVSAVYQSGSPAVFTQNIPIQQLSHEMPLISNSQALVTQSAIQTYTLNAKPVLEVCTTDLVARPDEVSSSHASQTEASAALSTLNAVNTGSACLSVSGSHQPSTNLQRSMFTVSTSGSSGQSETTVAQEMTTDSLPSLLLVPSDPTHNASLPITEVIESASVPYSSRLTAAHVQESVVNSTHCSTYDITAQVTNIVDATSRADDILLEYDSGKFGSHKQGENVLECENRTKQQCELVRDTGKLQSIPVFAGNNIAGLNSIDVSTASASSGARSELYNSNKEQRITVQTEMDSNMSGGQVSPSDSTVTRGRRRPLFVCRGPLMDTVTTLEGTISTSSCHKLRKDSETSSRKLPVMLGMCDCQLPSALYLILSVML